MDSSPVNLNQPGFTAPLAAAPLPTAGRPQFGKAAVSAMGMKWSALHDAVTVVGTLAGLQPEDMRPNVRNYPAVMRDSGGWRCELAEQGIDDLAAIMEPGLSALLAAQARGVNPSAAALALWQEFFRARNALLALAPQTAPAGALRV